jgi:hypothetical protein
LALVDHCAYPQPVLQRDPVVTMPRILGCFFDIGFMPPIAVMLLQWEDPCSLDVHHWTLPNGEHITGAWPRRFGIRIRRQAEDAYHFMLVWDSTYRQWFSLRRKEILGSAIETILAALGSQLNDLLDQPFSQMPGAA